MKALLGLGLKESKELVEKLPAELKSECDFDEMEKLKKKLEELQCIVKII